MTSDLAIRPEQTNWDGIQLAQLRQLGMEDAPEGDVQLFFHVAQRSGLDPFMRQIYMIGRKTKVKTYDERAKKYVERWITKYTIQTGIDGYRVMAERIAAECGDKIDIQDALWCGGDGVWRDTWLDTAPPAAAKVVILKNGQRRAATVMYAEYAQTINREGKDAPNSMWKRMPANQLAKCAEAAAWRKTYPQDYSGFYLEDAAHTIVDGEVVDTKDTPTPPRGTSGARSALGLDSAKEPQEAEQPQATDSEQVTIAAGQLARLNTLLEQEQLSDRQAKLDYLATTFHRSFSSSKDLSEAEVSQLIDYLETQATEPAEPATQTAGGEGA